MKKSMIEYILEVTDQSNVNNKMSKLKKTNKYERLHISIDDQIKYCPECKRVYKKADFIYKQYRNVEEEHYDKGLMPSYKLDRKICGDCKNDS